MKSSRSPKDAAVAQYFHGHAKDFDTIYESDKTPLRRLRDNLTRGVVTRRLDFVDGVAERLKPARVLDVGCGSGRMAIRLAHRGAHVVGLDFAPDMLALAGDFAAQAGVSDRCTFIEADFMEWEPDGQFDLGTALGVFDYVSDPKGLLAKLSQVCGGTIVGSFPKRLHPLVPLRYARLRASGCPVHFFSRQQVDELARSVVPRYRIDSFGRDFLLVGNP